MPFSQDNLLDPHGLRRRQKYDQKLRKSTVKSLDALNKATTLSSEIERQKRLQKEQEDRKKVEEVLKQMIKDKAFALEQISECSSFNKDKWHDYLDKIVLTDHSADAKLKELQNEVELERLMLVLNNKPKLLSGKMHGKKSPRAPFNNSYQFLVEEHSELMKKIRIEDLPKPNEFELKFIETLLGSLISSRDLYKSCTGSYL